MFCLNEEDEEDDPLPPISGKDFYWIYLKTSTRARWLSQKPFLRYGFDFRACGAPAVDHGGVIFRESYPNILLIIKWVQQQETFPFLNRTWNSTLILNYSRLPSPRTLASHFSPLAYLSPPHSEVFWSLVTFSCRDYGPETESFNMTCREHSCCKSLSHLISSSISRGAEMNPN